MQKLICFFPGAGFSLFFYKEVPLSSVYYLILAFKCYLQGINKNSFITLSGFIIHELLITALVFK